MRPPVDVGPAQVRGPEQLCVAGKARVMWDDGVLYIARSTADVVRVNCPTQPVEPPRVGQSWVAATVVGDVTFKRRGCSCGYPLGNVAFGTLRDTARYIEGVESTQTPVEAAAQTLTEADTP